MRRIFLIVLLMVVSCAIGGGVSWQHFRAAPTTTTTSTGAPAMPVLTEHFTLLPCSSSTTIGMEGCAEHQIVALDGVINHLRAEIFHRLRDSASKRRFLLAESTWHRYRRTSCESVADVDEGGTLAPVAFARCEVRVDQQHRANLSEQLKSYAEGAVAP